MSRAVGVPMDDEHDVLLISMRRSNVSQGHCLLFDQQSMQVSTPSHELAGRSADAGSTETRALRFAANRGISKDSRHTWTFESSILCTRRCNMADPSKRLRANVISRLQIRRANDSGKFGQGPGSPRLTSSRECRKMVHGRRGSKKRSTKMQSLEQWKNSMRAHGSKPECARRSITDGCKVC